VFLKEKVRPMSRVTPKREGLNRLQARGRKSAFKAKERIGPASEQAREIAAQRLLDARTWSAPRLEKAAKYVETELGPTIGKMLWRAAKKVEPPAYKRRGRANSLVMLAATGVLGAVGVIASRRNAINPLTRSEHQADRGRMGSEPSTDGQVRIP
jgi:hypothetical protein